MDALAVPRHSHSALRFALVYMAVFLWMGTYLPYWPVWLADRGMSSQQIGLLLGFLSWTRVVSSPIAGRWADRRGNAHRLVVLCMLATALCFAAFQWAHGFLSLALLMIALGLVMAPIVPLIDGLTLGAEAAGRLSYGPVRLWGSAAFIFASWFGGVMLGAFDETIVWWLLLGAAILQLAASALLPSPEPDSATDGTNTDEASSSPSAESRSERDRPEPSPAPSGARGGEFSPWSRRFGIFLGGAMLLNLSHAVLYAFGTQHWRGQGLDEGTVGMLWAESVIAEIILFALAPRLARWLTPRRLWLAAGIGGVIRWSMLASVTALPLLWIAQALHGLTFGALHLGAMQWLRQEVPQRGRALATTLFSSAGALALGLGLPLAGVVYGEIAGQAYWGMTLCSAAGLLLVLATTRGSARAQQKRGVSSGAA